MRAARSRREYVHQFARLLRLGSAMSLSRTVAYYGGTDKRDHGYVSAYSALLRTRRYRSNRLLEIGVGGWSLEEGYSGERPGGSLRVWRDYLPRSVIVGLDIEEKRVRLGPRVRFVRGDQTDPVALAKAVDALGGTPDIVIDDGSHFAGHAIATFDVLFGQMAPGSLYVVEDLSTSYWPHWGGGLDLPADSAVSMAQRLVNLVQARDPTFGGRWPDWGPKPSFERSDVAELHVFPGMFAVVKA